MFSSTQARLVSSPLSISRKTREYADINGNQDPCQQVVTQVERAKKSPSATKTVACCPAIQQIISSFSLVRSFTVSRLVRINRSGS